VAQLLSQFSLAEPCSVFLVSRPWWQAWCAYSGMDDDAGASASQAPPGVAVEPMAVEEGEPQWVDLSSARAPAVAAPAVAAAMADGVMNRPGPISNSSLLAPGATARVLRLRPGLTPARDYQLLPRAAWATLHKWYSGGPEIRRNNVNTRPGPSSRGGAAEAAASPAAEEADFQVELWPVFLAVGSMGKGALPAWGRVAVEVSALDTLEAVATQALKLWNDPPVANAALPLMQRVRVSKTAAPLS
jgi:hypothetical protein